MEVLPVINCLDRICAEDKLRKVKSFLKKDGWLHIDAGDGRFTFNKTWTDPTDWANLRAPFNLEVHLMVEEPEKYIESWIAAGARRLILHAETLTEETARNIVLRARKSGVGAMLSSNPHTDTKILWPLLKIFSDFQVLAVDPGPSGQKFLPIVLRKIRFLRNFAPNAKIEVDGGVDLDAARSAKDAGANIVVSASFIFNSKNPKKAYKQLNKI